MKKPTQLKTLLLLVFTLFTVNFSLTHAQSQSEVDSPPAPTSIENVKSFFGNLFDKLKNSSPNPQQTEDKNSDTPSNNLEINKNFDSNQQSINQIQVDADVNKLNTIQTNPPSPSKDDTPRVESLGFFERLKSKLLPSDKPESKFEITLGTFTPVDLDCKNLIVETSTANAFLEFSTTIAQLSLINVVAGITGKIDKNSNTQTLSVSDIKNIGFQFSKNFVWLPLDLELKYGNSLHESYADEILTKTAKNAIDYDYLEGTVNAYLSTIRQNSDIALPYTFQVFILKRNTFNASAAPGGALYIDYGLAKGRVDPDVHEKLLFAIAHELSHVLQRHQTKHLQARIVDTAILSYSARHNFSKNTTIKASDALGSIKDSILKAGTLFTMSKKIMSKNYADQELQADSCASKIILMNNSFKYDASNKTILSYQNSLEKRFIDKQKDVLHIASNKKTPSNNSSPLSEAKKLSEQYEALYEHAKSPIEAHPVEQVRIDNLIKIRHSLRTKTKN